jgi:hypothetical protein
MSARRVASLIVASAFLLSSVGVASPPAKNVQNWGQTVTGVQLGLYVDPNLVAVVGAPAVGMIVRNTGSSMRVVWVGERCQPSAAWMSTSEVAVFLRDRRGQRHKLRDVGPGPIYGVGCDPTPKPKLVQLKPGESHSEIVNLAYYRYFSTNSHHWEHGWDAGGDFWIHAEVRAGSDFFDPGATVISNEVQLHITPGAYTDVTTP